MGNQYHIPVLLQPAVALLEVIPGAKYVDATFGGGGHSAEIKRLGGQVLGIDQDPDSAADVHANFSQLEEIVKSHNWQPVAGVLFDLGVSLHQIATPSRGFSFQADGPLDMRMSPNLPYSAADLVNTLAPVQLKNIFLDYGEVSNSALVERIVAARPLLTTRQLDQAINSRDLSRRVFQALRIAVNDELGAIKAALPQALGILQPKGRIAVISFHSLEDRIVKQQFLAWQNSQLGTVVTKKPILPDENEVVANFASHSAKLRVFQKS